MSEYDDWCDYPEDYDEYEDEDYVGQVPAKTFIPLMKDVILRGNGINFALLMEHDVLNNADNGGDLSRVMGKDHSIHPRWNQPCLGEMRKYSTTHGEECTQPDNCKPSDLWHPFPDGTPVMVGTRFFPKRNLDIWNTMMDTVFDPETSPWKSGIGKPQFVMEGDVKVGVLMTDTDIDPTVMVNLFNVMKSMVNRCSTDGFKLMLEYGMEPIEAILALMLTGYNGHEISSPDTYVGQPDTYYVPSVFSVKKFLDKTPNDLSGGVFKNRVDYNRTQLEGVFRSEYNEGGLVLKEALSKHNLTDNPTDAWHQPKWTVPVPERIKGLKTIIHEAYDNETKFLEQSLKKAA